MSQALSNERKLEYERNFYSDALRRETQMSMLVLEARIILVDMELNVKDYGMKNGHNEKYLESMGNLRTIWSALDFATSLDDECYMTRVLSARKDDKINMLMRKIDELEKTIEASKRAWQGL